ncbi:MAG: hypothetical protein FJW37_13360 [Acidobacteria bacterium]|nr:hypothetical protein [Acidobacteriota bacterium]
MSSEFYVGYLPKMPPRLAGRVTRTVCGLALLAAAAALLLVFAQAPFPASRFEYLEYREYAGLLRERPYPRMITAGGTSLLVAPGKHGASGLVEDLDGRTARLQGALIERGRDRMLELLPGSIEAQPGPVAGSESATAFGTVTLQGEIVDSKCYLGVMNPGNGKVHRECAVRCLSGGLPPALVVHDSSGAGATLLLAGPGGRPLGRELLDFVAEPVEVTGRLARLDGLLVLEMDPARVRRLE